MHPSESTDHVALIVDVDETLLDTNPRKIAILRDLFGIEITYQEAQANYNLDNYLRSSEQVKRFFAAFHSGKYLHADVAIEYAPQALQRLASQIRIVYLTGRHARAAHPWMAQRLGTLQSLRQFGFPIPGDGNTSLVMKPYFAGFESIEKQAVADRAHKNRAVTQLAARQRVLAGIGDTYTDLSVYSDHGVYPICLKRPHWLYFQERLGELTIEPFVASNWLEAEKQVLALLELTDSLIR